jgi:hypothetical protein
MFSHDALCHVPFEGIEAYATSLRPKLRPGAHCFWTIADYAKCHRFIDARASVAPAPESQIGRRWPRELIARVALQFEDHQPERCRNHIEAPERPERSHWYDAGTERTVEILERLSYRVMEADVEVDPRPPKVHFVRP